MDTFLNKANIYHDLQSVTNISDWIRNCRGIVLVDSTVPILGYKEFFSRLEQFELQRAGNRKTTVNVQAKALEILLPRTITDVNLFVKVVMKEVFGQEKELPYAVWLEERGQGRYVKILISERYYSEEELIYEDRWKSDRFQNQITGRLCKSTDPNAKRIVKAGDLRKTWTTHFSLKTRMFSADGFARKNRDKKKRIGFDRLLNHIRQCIVAAFVKMKISFSKSFIIPKLKRKDWMNKYQNMNLTRINLSMQHIEQEIQEEWIAIRDGYFYQDTKTYDRFMALAKRYLNRFKNGFFNKKVVGNRKLKLSFSPFMNVVRVQENLDSLVEDFDKEIEEFRMKYRYGI